MCKTTCKMRLQTAHGKMCPRPTCIASGRRGQVQAGLCWAVPCSAAECNAMLRCIEHVLSDPVHSGLLVLSLEAISIVSASACPLAHPISSAVALPWLRSLT